MIWNEKKKEKTLRLMFMCNHLASRVKLLVFFPRGFCLWAKHEHAERNSDIAVVWI